MINCRKENEGPVITRRRMLRLIGGVVLLSVFGCESASTGIRREVGVWSQKEVEYLANQMLSESHLNDVAYAGSVLLDNQKGKPSFSKMSPVFTDEKVQIKTFVSPEPTPLTARIRGGKNDLVFDLRQRTERELIRVSVPESLHLAEIQLNHSKTKNYSDFITKFFVAKEIINVSAFEMVSAYLADHGIYNQYEKPSSPKLQRALQAGAMKGTFGEIPAVLMADVWAHFLLVPNFLVAQEQGRFSPGELKSGEMELFVYSAQVFQESGVLKKNNEGRYEWTNDTDRLFALWIDFGKVASKAIR